MEYRSSEIKAGMFIFISLIVLVIMIVMLGNLQDMFSDKRKQSIIFNYTGGLTIGATVRYAGLDVGKVTDIILLETQDGRDKVEVVTEIDPHIHLKKNSPATINTSGLMGGLYIDIRPGTRKSQMLKDGEPLEGHDAFELAQVKDILNGFLVQVERFTDLSDQLIADTRETLRQGQVSLAKMNTFIDSNQPVLHALLVNGNKVSRELKVLLDTKSGDIAKTLHHTASITETADELIREKQEHLKQIIDQTTRMTREMELLMADNRPGVTNVVATMDRSSARIEGRIDTIADNLNATLEQTNGMLVENRRNLMELVENTKEMTAALKDFSQDVKRNPWKLVRKTDEQPPIDYDQWDPLNSGEAIRMKRLDKVSNGN